jgi:hypothetical protein
MPPLYRWYYVAQVFAALAALAHLTQASIFLSQPKMIQAQPTTIFQANTLEFTLIFYHLPLAVSVTIGLIVTWKYWGWLVKDRKK